MWLLANPSLKGGEKEDAVGHSGRAGSQMALAKHPLCSAAHGSMAPGQEGSWQGGGFSLMPTITGYVIYYELSTHEDGMFCLSVAVFLL